MNGFGIIAKKRILNIGLNLSKLQRDPKPGALIFAMCVGLSACASNPPQPQLYPNAHYNRVGEAKAKRDIAYCEALAKEYVHNTDDVKKAAGGAVGSAAGGAALGAVGGAIAGDAGEGAAIGAAVGAAGSVLASLAKSGEPNPSYERFVDHCLRKEGYEPIGWSD